MNSNSAKFSTGDFVALLCAIGLGIAFLLMPWISLLNVGLSGIKLLTESQSIVQSDVNSLWLIPLAFGVGGLVAFWGLIDSPARRLTGIIICVMGIIGLLYYGIFFIQNAQSPLDATGVVGSGFWVGLFATLGLILQIFLPRSLAPTTSVLKQPSIDTPPITAADLQAEPAPRLLNILTVVTIIAVTIGLYMALGYAGTDVEQGDVQRIFYVHMPTFFGAFLAFGATVVGGIQYLRTRDVKWDTLALAGVEVGLAFGLVNLVTGAIWARPIWNTWWTWDPRLTSDAIMILAYAAYLMLRNGIENDEQRRRFAAVYGILAFATVIITLVIIRVRPDTIHPAVIGPSPQNAQGTFELQATSGVGAALGVNLLVWPLLVPITLMWYRIRLENYAQRVQALKARLLDL